MLEGQLEWTHPVEEVNEYIDNLQKAFGADKLQDEVKLINAVVIAGEFRHYFKTKKREYWVISLWQAYWSLQGHTWK